MHSRKYPTVHWDRIIFFSDSAKVYTWITVHVALDLRAHPTVGPTFSIAKKYFRETQISPHPTPLFPLTGNPQFVPGLEYNMFKRMVQQNKYRAYHFILRGTWVDWANIPIDHPEGTLGMWQARQISNFVKTLPEATFFTFLDNI